MLSTLLQALLQGGHLKMSSVLGHTLAALPASIKVAVTPCKQITMSRIFPLLEEGGETKEGDQPTGSLDTPIQPEIIPSLRQETQAKTTSETQNTDLLLEGLQVVILAKGGKLSYNTQTSETEGGRVEESTERDALSYLRSLIDTGDGSSATTPAKSTARATGQTLSEGQ